MTNEKMTPLSTNVVCCLLIAKRSGLCVKETEQGKQNFSKSKQTNKKKKTTGSRVRVGGQGTEI